MFVECTCRAVQGRKLLRPSPRVNLLILGILGRALTLTQGIALVDFSFPSNHYHIDLIAHDEKCLARFFNIVNSQLATRIGFEIHQWDSKVWSRRYTSIPALDEAAMVRCVRYIYAQGLRHHMVDNPLQFPGAHTLRARLLGERLVGKWFDGTAYGRAKRRLGAAKVNRDDFWIWYEIDLAPLPCWSHLSEADYRARVEALRVDIVIDYHAIWTSDGTRPIGAAAVLTANPTARPSKPPARSPAPRCHASTTLRRDRHRYRLRRHRLEYDVSSIAFREGELDVEFPTWSFRPLGPYALNGEAEPDGSGPPTVRVVPPPD